MNHNFNNFSLFSTQVFGQWATMVRPQIKMVALGAGSLLFLGWWVCCKMFSFCFGPEWYTLLHVSLLATEEKCFSSSHFHILFTPLCGDVRMLEKIIKKHDFYWFCLGQPNKKVVVNHTLQCWFSDTRQNCTGTGL